MITQHHHPIDVFPPGIVQATSSYHPRDSQEDLVIKPDIKFSHQIFGQLFGPGVKIVFTEFHPQITFSSKFVNKIRVFARDVDVW